jgi:CRISPR/Cas system-associated endonuclease/helicase Cas3
MTTTTATTSAAPFAAFAQLLGRVQRSRRNPIAGTRTDDRDRQRLLDDLRALSETRADFATACASRRSGR